MDDLLHVQTHHHCCFWVHMEHLMIARYARRVTVCLGHILHLRMMQMDHVGVGEGVGLVLE